MAVITALALAVVPVCAEDRTVAPRAESVERDARTGGWLDAAIRQGGA